jgi:hypothetical protein
MARSTAPILARWTRNANNHPDPAQAWTDYAIQARILMMRHRQGTKIRTEWAKVRDVCLENAKKKGGTA